MSYGEQQISENICTEVVELKMKEEKAIAEDGNNLTLINY